MITKEQFAAAVLYCKGLSGLGNAPASEYLQACYSELKNLFANSDQLHIAAREIAAKEELYGQYPSLRLWLKYCPTTREIQASKNKARAEWLECLEEMLYCDSFIVANMMELVDARGGEQGRTAIKSLGTSLQMLWERAKFSDKSRILKECADAWDKADLSNGILPVGVDDKKLLK